MSVITLRRSGKDGLPFRDGCSNQLLHDARITRDFGALPQFHGRGKAAHVELVEGRKFLRSQRRLNLIDDAVEPDEQFCLVFDPGLIMVANGFGKGRHGYGF